ncbi:MAG: ROK family protein, partial [Pseudomonadota bacterium]|nr:ROK family protein [Pseudomonadota bacterium]
LIGKPLKQDLEKILKRDVLIENDANCFAISEAFDGAGSKAHTVFGVILGTGVGAGIVIGKKIHTGKNKIAGEWGHNPLPWAHEGELQGRKCYCGRTGCLETFISGPAIEREFKNLHGSNLNMKNIVKESVAGNLKAEQVISNLEDRLARALAHVINILDPDSIVLGGGLSNIDRLYSNVPKIWAEYIFSDDVSTVLSKARFGDSSGVRGAAWL